MIPNETLFSVCNFIVLPGWLLLLFAPGWKWTERVIYSYTLPLILAAVYAVLLALNLGKAEGGFGSLDDVYTLFGTPQILLAGWIHYLAFDLFVGSWIVRDAQTQTISHLLIVPCLVLTFLAGPTGLLLYFVLRWALRRELVVRAPRASGVGGVGLG
ncbi:MAG: ABA4-like family protein [Pirellulales bacterium]